MKKHGLLLSIALMFVLSFFIFCIAKSSAAVKKNIYVDRLKDKESQLIKRQEKIKNKLIRIREKLEKVRESENNEQLYN